MHKIVIIAKYFYPLCNTRSKQAQLFVKALSVTNQVIVITAGTNFSGYKEPNIKVIGIGKPVHTSGYGLSNASKIYLRLNKELETTFGCGWANLAAKVVCDLVRKGWINILSISEPFDSHLVALKAAMKAKFNWLVFYSDPWPCSIMPYPYSKSTLPLISRYQEHISKQVLNQSDTVIFTNSKAAPYVQKKLGLDLATKSCVVRHLVDVKSHSINIQNTRNLVHIGHLSKERVSKKFFTALFDAIIINRVFDKLLLIGRVCPEMHDLVNKMGVGEYVEFIGEIDQTECQQIAFNSSSVLLIEAEMSESPFSPSKLAEYFVFGIPILAITNQNSESSVLIKEYLNGIVCYYNQKSSEICETIMGLNAIKMDCSKKKAAAEVFSSNQVISTLSAKFQ